jgi:hypothetical protein
MSFFDCGTVRIARVLLAMFVLFVLNKISWLHPLAAFLTFDVPPVYQVLGVSIVVLDVELYQVD